MVLKQFGEYFFEFCKRSGYDHMLRTLGGNLYEFIENLDALHSYLSLSYQASRNHCCGIGRETKHAQILPLDPRAHVSYSML